MKPRNKKQQAIYDRWASHGLTKSNVIPADVERWALRKLIRPGAMSSGHRAWCTECGNSFAFETPKRKGARYTTCPHCGRRLLVTDTRKSTLEESGFFQQLDVDGEFQVLRMYEYYYRARKGRKSGVFFKHCYDLYLTEGFRDRYRFAVYTRMFYYRYASPFGDGELELRNDRTYTYDDPARGWYTKGIYPKIRLQPWLEKYDIRPPFLGLDTYEMVLRFVAHRDEETAWKLRRWNPGLCRYFLMYHESESDFFRQLCLAHKHDYKPTDAAVWFDHLRMLKHEGRDIHNPAVIFPKDLDREHRLLIERQERRRLEEERLREERRKVQEEMERLERENADSKTNKNYRARFGQALGVVVTKGDIEIKLLQDVQDFFEQGKELHQCVYGARYYEHKDAAILCVRVGGVRTETVEVFLRDGKIGQCRGVHNQPSPRHEEIFKLAKKSVRQFISAIPNRPSAGAA